MFICELVKSKFIAVVYYFSLPVIVPIMPGMPWTYVISSDPLLVHSGCCFWTDHKIADEIKPVNSPAIKEAQTSTEPEQALIPSNACSKLKGNQKLVAQGLSQVTGSLSNKLLRQQKRHNWVVNARIFEATERGGGVLPYKGLMGTCGQPGYVFRDFCLEQGIEFIIFCLNQGIDLWIFVLNWSKCLKQGIKNRNSIFKWVAKSAIFVLNRVRVWGAAPHLPNRGYIEYPPPPPGN